MGLLGMSAAQYDSMKDASEEPDMSERIGIYRKGKMKYAIVARLPKEDTKRSFMSEVNTRLLNDKMGLLVGSAAMGVGSGMAMATFIPRTRNGGAVDATNTNSDEKTWIAAIDQFIEEVYLLHATIHATYNSDVDQLIEEYKLGTKDEGTFKKEMEMIRIFPTMLLNLVMLSRGAKSKIDSAKIQTMKGIVVVLKNVAQHWSDAAVQRIANKSTPVRDLEMFWKPVQQHAKHIASAATPIEKHPFYSNSVEPKRVPVEVKIS